MDILIRNKRSLQLCLLFFCVTFLTKAQNAQFTADKTSGCFPVTVHFSDASTIAGATRWVWNLGNGNTSEVQNPSAIYTEAGTFTVSLTVYNGTTAIDSEVKTGYIVIHGYPSVDFSFDKNSGCSPLQVQFTNAVNQTNGAISNWQWTFGDGGTSSQSNPSYIFNQPGTPSVALKATNIHGCEATTTKASAINVIGPLTDFSANATKLCQVPSAVQFTNLSTGTGVLSYLWNFGDGGTSTQKDPSHTFTNGGSFTVRLTTTDAQGCSSFDEMQILAGTEDGLSFTPAATELCTGQLLSFSVQSSAPIVSMNWNFGNNTTSTSATPVVSFPVAGTYAITLMAQLQGKTCQSVVTRNVVVLPNPAPTFTSALSCSNALVLTSTTTGATRIEWSVDGSVISTTPTLTYNPPVGSFEITLTAFNAKNCATQVKRMIVIPQTPLAGFTPFLEQDCTLPSLSGCAPFKVDFKNISTAGSAFSSSWSLGEGVTSTAKDPTRTFNNPGTFPIRLIITDARGCKDSIRSTVHVANAAPTVSSATLDDDEVCSGEIVTFNANVLNADLLCWNFGDEGTAIGKNPTHQYIKPGTYKVTLTARNAGCITVFELPQVVKVKNPLVDFELRKSCDDPYRVDFIDKTENADALTWNVGDGFTTTARNFSHRYDETGNYQVTLTGVNNSTNCSVPVFGEITIQDIKADFMLATETPCKNNPTPTSDLSEFAASWLWYIDNQLTTQTRNPILTFQTAGQHTVRLDALDSDGCVDTKEITIQVPNITGNFTFSATSDCEEFTVQFNDASFGSPAIQNWHWDFGDGTTSDQRHPLHVFHEKDSFDISLRLTNPEGNCSFTTKDAIIFSVPLIEFNAFKTTHCLNETIRFSNTTLNAKDFLWTFEAGGQSTLFIPTTFYSTAGSYDVTLAATDKYGCTLSVTRPDHIIVAEPHADFEAFQTSGECPPLTSIFKSTSTGSNLTYLWNFGNATLSAVKDPACTYTRPGSYDVLLKVTDQFGCSDSKLVEDLIRVGGPSGTFEQTSISMCSKATVDFHATTTNTLTYEWDFGDGNVFDLHENKTEHSYAQAGSYRPSLVLIDDKNCRVVADGGRQIIVHDSTAVEFTYEPMCIFNGESLSLKTSNQDNETHEWVVNGTVMSEGVEVSAAFDLAGVYEVELRGTNEFGCISLSKQEIKIHGKIEMIPNVFTATGDSFNEFFEIPGVENSEWALSVFNRWGREVFSQRNYLNAWRADDLAAGTYYYYLNNQVCPDRTYKGYIHLLK